MTASPATDPFDVKGLALSPEQVAELAPLQKRLQPKSKQQRRARLAQSRTRFVILPYEQTLSAAGQLHNATLAVLAELAYQVFKNHRNQVPLANTALRSAGISRHAKLRALRQLEAVGLIEVAWRGRRCPLVRVLWE